MRTREEIVRKARSMAIPEEWYVSAGESPADEREFFKFQGLVALVVTPTRVQIHVSRGAGRLLQKGNQSCRIIEPGKPSQALMACAYNLARYIGAEHLDMVSDYLAVRNPQRGRYPMAVRRRSVFARGQDGWEVAPPLVQQLKI